MAILKFFWHLLPTGIRLALSPLPFQLKAACKHQIGKWQARRYRGQVIKLHLGSGDTIKPGYVNVDNCFRGCVKLDLREKLPFADESVSDIYSEHFWEHLTEKCGRRLFQEAFRVLTPGGKISTGVPDGKILLESYAHRLPIEQFCLVDPTDLPAVPTRMQMVNQLFRRFNHQYIYDFETMEKVLQEIGFENVAHRPFDPATDSAHRREWTLYVDAYKPGRK